MREVTILCESASCNSGYSAADREAALIPRSLAENVRGDYEKHARGAVSRELRYTPHVRVSGVDRWGRTRYACETCGHERVYGTVAESWREGPYS